MSHCDRRAFSTAELLIALAILGIVVVVIIGLFLQLLKASSKGVEQTVALEVAENRLAELSRETPATWASVSREDHTTSDPRSKTSFHYRLVPTELSTTGDNEMGNLYQLDLEVFWFPENPSNPQIATRIGSGRLSVHLSRTIYVQDMKTVP